MFIRRTPTRHKATGEAYFTHRLVRSERRSQAAALPDGPRFSGVDSSERRFILLILRQRRPGLPRPLLDHGRAPAQDGSEVEGDRVFPPVASPVRHERAHGVEIGSQGRKSREGAAVVVPMRPLVALAIPAHREGPFTVGAKLSPPLTPTSPSSETPTSGAPSYSFTASGGTLDTPGSDFPTSWLRTRVCETGTSSALVIDRPSVPPSKRSR